MSQTEIPLPDGAKIALGLLAPLLAPAWVKNRTRLTKQFAEICKERGVPNYVPRFQTGTLEANGQKLHLEIIKTPKAKATVVFMPGTNAYALLYGEFLVALADAGYNILAFDPRGHGHSSGSPGSYTIDQLVNDYGCVVEEARRRFNVPVIACGSSQGGIVTLYYATKDPALAAAVCHNIADLSDPDSTRLVRSPALGQLKPLLDFSAKFFPELPIPMLAYLDLEKERVRGLGTAKAVVLQDPLVHPFVRLKTLASLGSEPPPQPLEKMKVPVFVLQAGDDTIFPSDYVKKVFDRLPKPKQLKEYPGLPHYMIVDHVPDFLPDVLQFLKKHSKT